ncbi:hypothetical protein Tco_0839033 [Tanacetum coccineum]|uniref:RNA-directed DNA polymerase, eukaryota n=1 Tax=Tanacetum coccineum TaxID=301880 RepID=A0ABQ5AQJ2_9ASTR
MPDKDKVISEDPFNLYDILNKIKDSGDNLKYLLGFTPSVINVEEVNKKVEVAISNRVNKHVNSSSNKLEKSIPKGKLLSNNSVCSKRVHTNGSILQLMDELVKVGQTMSYNMEGCGSNEEILSDRILLLKVLNDINSIDSLESAQKSKVHWAIEGDENTKFIHGIINSKHSQLAIHGTLVDDEWIVDPLVVKSLLLKYFSTSPHICFADQFTNKLSLKQQADLERNVF